MTTVYEKGLSDFIFISKYARYNDELKRRETWEETVERLTNMHVKKYKDRLSKEELDDVYNAFNQVLDKDVLPSMRSLQFGGEAIEVKNSRMYNCSVRHVDSIRAIAEIHWLLLCGCGVGIGLNKFFLGRLPDLVNENDKTGNVITYVIDDTIEGWANSVEALLNCYFKGNAYSGKKIVFDYSKIRKKGTRLKVGGGKAPGYHGLKLAHGKIKYLLDHVIENLKLSKIRSIDVYDIIMHCADSVLSGGIRRSATCVLFELDDIDMMNAKSYFSVEKYKRLVFDQEDNTWHVNVIVNNKSYNIQLKANTFEKQNNVPSTLWYDYTELVNNHKISWIHLEPQRARSNNSVLLLRDQVTYDQFIAINKITKQFGEPGFTFVNHPWTLFNPCFELSFIPVNLQTLECGVQFCNLVTQNGRQIQSKEDFLRTVEAATLIATLQAGFTEFDFLKPISKQLTEEEALLGVSITGMMENPDIILSPEIQREAAEIAKATNKKWAKIIGINPAARITCIKPEGTCSLLLNTSSGIHPHYAKKYIRRVICNKIEAPYQYLKSFNDHACEESVWSSSKNDDVVSFPQETKKNALTKKDISALEHLEIIRSTQINWVRNGTSEFNKKPLEHNVSCTVSVKEHEWEDVFKYIFQYRADFTAVSLLPDYGDTLYQQAPNEEIITKDQEKIWDNLTKNWQEVDYTHLVELDDTTKRKEEIACGGGKCEI